MYIFFSKLFTYSFIGIFTQLFTIAVEYSLEFLKPLLISGFFKFCKYDDIFTSNESSTVFIVRIFVCDCFDVCTNDRNEACIYKQQ